MSLHSKEKENVGAIITSVSSLSVNIKIKKEKDGISFPSLNRSSCSGAKEVVNCFWSSVLFDVVRISSYEGDEEFSLYNFKMLLL